MTRQIMVGTLPTIICLVMNMSPRKQYENIFKHNYAHEAQQQDHAAGIDIALILGIYLLVSKGLDGLRNDETHHSAAVQCRNGQQIHHCQVDAQEGTEIHKAHEGLMAVIGSVGRLGHHIHDHNRAAQILDTGLTGKEHLEAQPHHADRIGRRTTDLIHKGRNTGLPDRVVKAITKGLTAVFLRDLPLFDQQIGIGNLLPLALHHQLMGIPGIQLQQQLKIRGIVDLFSIQ